MFLFFFGCLFRPLFSLAVLKALSKCVCVCVCFLPATCFKLCLLVGSFLLVCLYRIFGCVPCFVYIIPSALFSQLPSLLVDSFHSFTFTFARSLFAWTCPVLGCTGEEGGGVCISMGETEKNPTNAGDSFLRSPGLSDLIHVVFVFPFPLRKGLCFGGSVELNLYAQNLMLYRDEIVVFRGFFALFWKVQGHSPYTFSPPKKKRAIVFEIASPCCTPWAFWWSATTMSLRVVFTFSWNQNVSLRMIL